MAQRGFGLACLARTMGQDPSLRYTTRIFTSPGRGYWGEMEKNCLSLCSWFHQTGPCRQSRLVTFWFFYKKHPPQDILALQNKCKQQNRRKLNEVMEQRQTCKMQKNRINLQGGKFLAKATKWFILKNGSRGLHRTLVENWRFHINIQLWLL